MMPFAVMRLAQSAAPSGSVFNPGALGAGASLSAGNTVAALAGAGSARLLNGRSSGKWQFSFTYTSDPGGAATLVGFAQASDGNGSYPGFSPTSVGWFNVSGNLQKNATNIAYGASYAVGAEIDCVLDFTAGTATFFKNGVSQGAYTHGLSGLLVPMVGNASGGGGTVTITVRTTSLYPQSGATQW